MSSYAKLTVCLITCVVILQDPAAAQSYLTAEEKAEIRSLQKKVDSLKHEISLLSDSINATVELIGNVTLRSSPSPGVDKIGTVKSGTVVKVLRGDGDSNSYVFISHNGKEGWVHKEIAFGSKSFFPPEVDDLMYKIEKIQKTISVIKTPTCEERLGGGPKANSACRGNVEPGMNKNMVKEAWGSPKDINTTITEYTTSEQWVYGSPTKRRYVYFRNGVVTTIQK